MFKQKSPALAREQMESLQDPQRKQQGLNRNGLLRLIQLGRTEKAMAPSEADQNV